MARRSAEAQPRRWRPGARRRAVRPDPAWINTGGRPLASLAATVRRDGWELRPAPRRLGGPARKAADSLRTPGSHLLAVRHEGDLAGLVAIEPELDPLAPALIAAARLADPLIAADRRSGVGEHVRADRMVADGTRLARSLRKLQAEGSSGSTRTARSIRVSCRHPAFAVGQACEPDPVRPGDQPPSAAARP